MPWTTIEFGEMHVARKAAITLGRRNAAVLADELLGEPVELGRRDSWLGVLAQQRDGCRDDLARALHPFDLGLGFSNDHAAGTCSNARWISANTSFSRLSA